VTRENTVPPKVLSTTNFFLIGIGLVSVFTWAYAIYFYVWTGARQFASAFEIVLLICWPPVAAILTFASLRLKPSGRVDLAMACLATCGSLYVTEVLLRFMPSLLGTGRILTTWADGASEEKKKEIAQFAAGFGVNFDTRDRIEVLVDAQSRGIDAVPALYPSALLEPQPGGPVKSMIRIDGAEILPLGGISNKLSVLCNELGDYVFYQSDARGFRNPKGTWRSPRLDLAIVGDSFAQGFCVQSHQHFVNLLRQHYPATLSLGMGSNGPLLELATLKEFLPSLKPKIVLWVYFEKNDLNELRHEARSPLLLHYLKAGFRQELNSKQAKIDHALLAYVEKQKLKALRRQHERKSRRQSPDAKKLTELAKLTTLRSSLGLISRQETLVEEEARANREVDMALFKSILMQAKSTVESWGGSLYFVYFPQWERYASSKPLKVNRKQVLEIVTGLQIPLIDLHSTLRSHTDPLSLFPFRLFGHYNADGNRLVAEAVLKQLAR